MTRDIAKIDNYFDGWVITINFIFSFVFIVLNVRNEIESKYPSIIFLSIVFVGAKAKFLICNL